MKNDNFLEEAELLYSKIMKVTDQIIDTGKTLEEQDDKTKAILADMYKLYSVALAFLADKHEALEQCVVLEDKLNEIKHFVDKEKS